MFSCLLPMKVVESPGHLKSNYALRFFVVAAKVSRQEVGLCVNGVKEMRVVCKG